MALAGSVGLAALASCQDGQCRTQVPAFFSWLALECLQALWHLVLKFSLAEEATAQGTAPPGVGDSEGHTAAREWKFCAARALSAAVRNFGREAHDSLGQRRPGGFQGAGPAGQGIQRTVES